MIFSVLYCLVSRALGARDERLSLRRGAGRRRGQGCDGQPPVKAEASPAGRLRIPATRCETADSPVSGSAPSGARHNQRWPQAVPKSWSTEVARFARKEGGGRGARPLIGWTLAARHCERSEAIQRSPQGADDAVAGAGRGAAFERAFVRRASGRARRRPQGPAESLDCFASLAMTGLDLSCARLRDSASLGGRGARPLIGWTLSARHCERSEAIQRSPQGADHAVAGAGRGAAFERAFVRRASGRARRRPQGPAENLDCFASLAMTGLDLSCARLRDLRAWADAVRTPSLVGRLQPVIASAAKPVIASAAKQSSGRRKERTTRSRALAGAQRPRRHLCAVLPVGRGVPEVFR